MPRTRSQWQQHLVDLIQSLYDNRQQQQRRHRARRRERERGALDTPPLPMLEALEGRRLLTAATTFVNDNWHFVADNDASTSLTVGDTVRNDNDVVNPAGITVSYGVTGFGTVTSGSFAGSVAGSTTINNAIAGTTASGTVNVLSGL